MLYFGRFALSGDIRGLGCIYIIAIVQETSHHGCWLITSVTRFMIMHIKCPNKRTARLNNFALITDSNSSHQPASSRQRNSEWQHMLIDEARQNGFYHTRAEITIIHKSMALTGVLMLSIRNSAFTFVPGAWFTLRDIKSAWQFPDYDCLTQHTFLCHKYTFYLSSRKERTTSIS